MNILLISDNRFPDADAGAVRENVFANMLINEGHKLYRVGRFCRSGDVIDNVICIPVPDKGKNEKGNILNLLLFNHNVMRSIKESNKKYHYDGFLITGCKARLVFALKSYAIKNNIRLVYNSVEYYSENQFRYKKIARQFINNRLIANKIIDQNFGVISISSFLKSHFEKKGILSVRIPFILDKDAIHCKFINNTRVEIAYVGRPSRSKDYLKDFIDAMTQLTDDELKKIRLTIVGVNQTQLIENYYISNHTLTYLGDSIRATGLLPRDKAMNILSGADFTILFRSDTEVYAKAGFPTKVTESLMSGVPVITNLTSDLGMYIIDGVNGLVIKNSEGIVDCYRRAISMPHDQLLQMKQNARKIAEKELDAKCYSGLLNSLFIT